MTTAAGGAAMRARRRALLALFAVAVVALPNPATSGSIWDRRGIEPYSLPLGRAWLTRDAIVRPHHDYPASDIYVPTGTRVFSVQAGHVVAVLQSGNCGLGVVIDGFDGFRYTYCHAARVLVAARTDVRSGQPIMTVGSSGSSWGRTHLHFQIADAQLRRKCPQPLMLAWWRGRQVTPRTAPYSGCSY